jgi:uridine kinase
MRAQENFDHPDAFDHALLATHMRQMLQGDTVSCPMYDYKTHNRKKDTRIVPPHRVIILEGILALSTAQLRELMEVRVFVDVALDICCARRLKRDISERGRTLDSVIQQYEQTVQPMYLQYIEPSKEYADILIPQGGKNSVAIDVLTDGINGLLQKEH